jgi:hypothetical protein
MCKLGVLIIGENHYNFAKLMGRISETLVTIHLEIATPCFLCNSREFKKGTHQ